MGDLDTKAKIISAYQEHWMDEGKDPATVYKFCKGIDIPERSFYDHFSSFESIRNHFWKNLLMEIMKGLEDDETFKNYSGREKWLAFHFSLFEKLTGERSYVLSLWADRNPMHAMKALKSFRKGLVDKAEQWLEQAEEEGQVANIPLLDGFRGELAFWQVLFLLQFWKNDESPSFERTDAAIEKSTHLLFEALACGIFEPLVDFLKFLAPDLPNPLDLMSKAKRAF